MWQSQVENEHYSICLSTEDFDNYHLPLSNGLRVGLFCHIAAPRPIATMWQVLTQSHYSHREADDSWQAFNLNADGILPGTSTYK